MPQELIDDVKNSETKTYSRFYCTSEEGIDFKFTCKQLCGHEICAQALIKHQKSRNEMDILYTVFKDYVHVLTPSLDDVIISDAWNILVKNGWNNVDYKGIGLEDYSNVSITHVNGIYDSFSFYI